VKRVRFGLLGVALLAVLAFSPATMAATTRVVVTPTNHQGWVLDPFVLQNPPGVPWGFNGPADSDSGNGSLRFGPVPSTPPQAKYEAQPPDLNRALAGFDSFAYEFQVLAPAAVGVAAKQFYTNVYVDSAANGIGFFGTGATSSGFYDCRLSYIPQSSVSGWNGYAFTGSTAANSLASRHGSCANTLDAIESTAPGSEIQFFRINGGDTGAGDQNLEGAYDLVGVSFNGNTTLYDFEPYAVAVSKDQCKDGGWQNVKRADGTSFKNQGDCIQYVNTGK
jgi:hypothetical protein